MGVAGFRLPPDDFEAPDDFKVFNDFKDFKDISVLGCGITALASLLCRDPLPAGGVHANETRYKQQIVHLERCFL